MAKGKSKMKKFKLTWSETIIQYWEKEVEAETEQEAMYIYFNGEHITGDEYIIEESFLDSEFQNIEEIKTKKKKK